MLYLIRGAIFAQETPQARVRAAAGEFDPPMGVRCVSEFEEPNGSYVEVVEADDPAAVSSYVDQSRFLFKTIATSRLKTFAYTGQPCDSAYLVAAKGPAVATIEIPNAVLDALTERGERFVIVNRTSHSDLFAEVSAMLPHCDEVDVVPILDVETVWALGQWRSASGVDQGMLPEASGGAS